METSEQYRARKRRETQLIGQAPLAPWPTAGFDRQDLAGRKRDVFRAHPAFRPAATFPETNWSNARFVTLGEYSIEYEYQRFDLRISAPPVYPALGSSEHIFYTCSGMAAVTAVILALDRLATANIEFWSITDAYFETQHVVNHYANWLDVRIAASFGDLAENAGDAFVIVHIDSISANAPDDLWDVVTDRVILALFDTTCYSRGDSQIEETVGLLEARGIPVVLVRSHLKLDMLGLETGRLGSVHLRIPAQCDGYPRQVIQAVAHLLPDVVRVFGTAPSIDRFLIVADEAELLKLSVKRADRIKDNSAALVDELERVKPGVSVRRYHHGMFMTVHSPEWTEPEPVRAIATDIAVRCNRAGYNVARATSFGFDFTVVTEVMDVATGKFCLRLAPSDEPLEVLLPIVSLLISALNCD